MSYLRLHLGFCALVTSLCLAARPAQAQSAVPRLQCPNTVSPDTNLPDKTEGCFYGDIYLKRTSFDMAKMVCTTDSPDGPNTCPLPELIMRLGNMDQRCTTQTTRALTLRQEINDLVLTASLEADGYVAEIDSETAQIRAVHDHLADKRDRAVGKSTFGSAVGTAGGAVGSALALASDTAMTVGSWVGAVFGAVGAGYSFAQIFVAKGSTGCFPDYNPNWDPNSSKETQCPDLKEPVKKLEPKSSKLDPCGDSISHGCSPSILSYFLFEIDPGFHSKPDPMIETYLITSRPELNRNSYRSELMGEWGTSQDTIEALKSKDKASKLSKDERAIELLSTRNESPRKLSIDDLTDRTNKLADVRTIAARINRDLSRLTADLAKSLRCAGLN